MVVLVPACFYPTPLQGGDMHSSPGAGKEAERRYQQLHLVNDAPQWFVS
jgi:hypothetical protein